MKYLCPSILAADFSRLGEQVKQVEQAGADILHCDIMDGHFVPNISFGPDVVKAVNGVTDLPLDVHLMIENADRYVDKFADAGADYISVHVENNVHLNRLVNKIKDRGVKAGVVLNPATPVSMLDSILPFADFILVMSVNPGFGGQKFIEAAYTKIKALKLQIMEKDYNCLIEVDGGVSLSNMQELSDAGTDMFVCGASIFNSGDINGTINKMKEILV